MSRDGNHFLGDSKDIYMTAIKSHCCFFGRRVSNLTITLMHCAITEQFTESGACEITANFSCLIIIFIFLRFIFVQQKYFSRLSALDIHTKNENRKVVSVCDLKYFFDFQFLLRNPHQGFLPISMLNATAISFLNMKFINVLSLIRFSLPFHLFTPHCVIAYGCVFVNECV